jgi:hypothetical protein
VSQAGFAALFGGLAMPPSKCGYDSTSFAPGAMVESGTFQLNVFWYKFFSGLNKTRGL